MAPLLLLLLPLSEFNALVLGSASTIPPFSDEHRCLTGPAQGAITSIGV